MAELIELMDEGKIKKYFNIVIIVINFFNHFTISFVNLKSPLKK